MGDDTCEDKVIFESCKRKITCMLGPDALKTNSIWEDLRSNGFYGLMWDKNNQIRKVTDVCC